MFNRLRPLIEESLLNPQDKWVVMGARQLIVPLKVKASEEYPLGQAYEELPTDSPNLGGVYLEKPLPFPYEWDVNLVLDLQKVSERDYRLSVGIYCCGPEEYISDSDILYTGNIPEIARQVGSDSFESRAVKAFNVCSETVQKQTMESKRKAALAKIFAATELNDYDSVMDFMASQKKGKIRKVGWGLELFRYGKAICLLDPVRKKSTVLVDRDRKVKICSIEDFSEILLSQIRQENKDWNMTAYSFTVGNFDNEGKAPVTWVISPYFYCPADEDGFGEEEEYEVAVTCHINTEGKIADTPVWKPYTGPCR